MAEKPQKPRFSVVETLTLPILSFKDRKEVFVRIESEIYSGSQQADADGKPRGKPVQMCRAVELETGQLVEFILPTVLAGILREKTGGNYVGKEFHIMIEGEKGAAGQRYKVPKVYEIKWEG